jgi:multisubunit Na+/H+ antiporter MnhC subunit
MGHGIFTLTVSPALVVMCCLGDSTFVSPGIETAKAGTKLTDPLVSSLMLGTPDECLHSNPDVAEMITI